MAQKVQETFPGIDQILDRARLFESEIIHVCAGCYCVLPNECESCETADEALYTYFPIEDEVRIGDYT